jgi:hypothetical protein
LADADVREGLDGLLTAQQLAGAEVDDEQRGEGDLEDPERDGADLGGQGRAGGGR